MKKLFVLIVIFLILFCAGCGSQDKGEKSDADLSDADAGNSDTGDADENQAPDDDPDSVEEPDDGSGAEESHNPVVDEDSGTAVSSGEIFLFGSYEQDNIATNGKEPIEWRVMQKVAGTRALLLADKGLYPMRFDDDSGRWKESEIREWLNGTFYEEAFTSEEKSKIISSSIVTESSYKSSVSYTTADKIFLLSRAQAAEFFPKQCDCVVYPTEYAKANGAKACDEEWCHYYDCGEAGFNGGDWWLRSPSSGERSAVSASYDGLIHDGYSVAANEGYVARPALWLWIGGNSACENGKYRCNKVTKEVCENGFWNAYEICGYTCNPDKVQCEECESGLYQCSGNKSQKCVDGSWNSGTACEMGCDPSTGKCSADGGFIGNLYKLGTYEQDNDIDNGREPIEWRIIDIVGNKAFLLADKGLDVHIFNDDEYHRKWEESGIRAWLNSEFYNTVFTDDEKKKILLSEIETEKEANNSTDYTTSDKVFLLSLRDLNKYYPIPEGGDKMCDRIAYPTEYARANGAAVCDYEQCKEYECGEAEYNATKWWIRTPASIDRYRALCVDFRGGASPRPVYDTDCTVRPALWMEL